jgi:hypothetical protein
LRRKSGVRKASVNQAKLRFNLKPSKEL